MRRRLLGFPSASDSAFVLAALGARLFTRRGAHGGRGERRGNWVINCATGTHPPGRVRVVARPIDRLRVKYDRFAISRPPRDPGTKHYHYRLHLRAR